MTYFWRYIWCFWLWQIYVFFYDIWTS